MGNSLSKLVIGASCIVLSGGLSPAENEELARKYAPILRFDNSAWDAYGYPMDPAIWLQRDCGSDEKKKLNRYQMVEAGCQNNVLDVTSNPTFYRILDPDNPDGVTIDYWWFYGYQSPCVDAGPVKIGDHPGDWEHVQVHVDISTGREVLRVTYFQHGGHYTTTTGNFEHDAVNWYDGVYGHPYVYVGKIGHPSYFNKGGFGNGCGYYWDWRNPHSGGKQLKTEYNLINLAENPQKAEWITNQIRIYGNFPNKNGPIIEMGAADAGVYYQKCQNLLSMPLPRCTF